MSGADQSELLVVAEGSEVGVRSLGKLTDLQQVFGHECHLGHLLMKVERPDPYAIFILARGVAR